MKIFNLILVCLLALLTVFSQTQKPKTVRDYFNLLPQSYFDLESCRPETDKNCVKARKEYLERFLEVEDNVNGYFEASGDGSQEKLKMTLFKRPDKTYLIGLYVYGEWGEKYYFLNYKNGKWSDVSRKIIPKYKKSNIYEMPRKGTTVEVFERINYDVETELGEKGKKLYDLIWKNGKFTIAK